MSILSQLQAALADGTIPKGRAPTTAKPRKAKAPINPNIAEKYTYPGKRLPGERHGFKACPPPPKPTMYEERRITFHGRFMLPVLTHYAPETFEAAQYHPFDFIGTSPVWTQHLHLPRS